VDKADSPAKDGATITPSVPSAIRPKSHHPCNMGENGAISNQLGPTLRSTSMGT